MRTSGGVTFLHSDLLKMIKEFRDDEMEHHDTGLENDAESVSGLLCVIVFLISVKVIFNIICKEKSQGP